MRWLCLSGRARVNQATNQWIDAAVIAARPGKSEEGNALMWWLRCVGRGTRESGNE